MSNKRVNVDAFIHETDRLDELRTAAIFKKLGGLGLSPDSVFDDLSKRMNSEPGDGIAALYALGGLDQPDGRSDIEKAEDEFDAKVAESFDAEETMGYHFLSAEVGRLALTSEESIKDNDGRLLQHTVLVAQVADGSIELLKYRQSGPRFKVLEVFPEDWQTVENAVSELSRVNSLIEQEKV